MEEENYGKCITTHNVTIKVLFFYEMEHQMEHQTSELHTLRHLYK